MKNMLTNSLNDAINRAITTVQSIFDELEIDAYLIGARARDIWFLPKRSPRVTKDIDWVIAHSNEDLFKELKKILIEREKYTETTNPLRLKNPEGIDVDLIPFDYPDTPHFIGLHEIFERGVEKNTFSNGTQYRLATLPSIVFLKFIAWDNRPENRRKDIEDIVFIIQNYDIYSTDILDNHYELYTELDSKYIGARVIGRKINYILGDSIIFKEQIIKIIEQQIALATKSKIVQLFWNEEGNTEEFGIQILHELLIGIKES
jgi:predicted nucleotidyltransferase